MAMNDEIRTYLAEIGRRGGKRSKRKLDPETARTMVKVREARKLFRKFYASCFWSSPPDLQIGKDDVEWVARTLMKNGNLEAWRAAQRLCR
jgi:hypothetical protein